ncbi:MAG TPA: PHP domain-containing protein [Acidimicrobiia bacterium]|nr:PHP domain-containing protein [Acidimicrobiia bacterium]
MGPAARDPAATLERIAYLRDRAHHPARRVRAFFRAAATLREHPAEEIEALAAAGRLQELPWVGPVIAGIVTEVLEGQTPEYLERLEVETMLEPGEGLEILEMLRGDLHSHTLWSDGGASVEAMASAARDLGHDYLAITDHSPRLQIAHGLDRARLEEQLAEVAALNEALAPFRILTGMEVDILEDGSLDDPGGLLSQLDIVVGSVHSHLRMPAEPMTERLEAAVAHPDLDVLGHCTGRLVTGRGRPQSEFDPAAVFDACVRNGTAVEVNCRPERVDPPDDLLTIALDAGCLLAVDTDAHAPGQLEWRALGAERLARLGVDAETASERIVNVWPLDRLLEWAAG